MIVVRHEELKSLKSNPPISKAVKTFFIILQVIFSRDFGFIKYKSTLHELTVKLGSLVLYSTLGVYFVTLLRSQHELPTVYLIWYILFLFENYAHVIILIVTPEKKTFYNFIAKLSRIDKEVDEAMITYNLNSKILLLSILSFILKIVFPIVYYFYREVFFNSLKIYIVEIPVFLCQDLPLLMSYILFDATYVRLVYLRNSIGIKKIEEIQNLYKYLIDSVENAKKAFDYIFCVTFVVNIPALITVMYTVIKNSQVQSKHPMFYVAIAIELTSFFIKIFAPAITAGSLSAEVNKMKIILHDMLIVERDEKQIENINRFINYIKVRPFKFRVFKIIPLDATFPIVMLDVCVTNLIIVLQLTHTY